MKVSLRNLYILPALIAGLGLILAGRVAAQTFTTLHSFVDTDGYNPMAGVILSGNTLYGVTDSGGSTNHGAVFAVNTDGTGYTDLYSFTGGNDGRNPDGTLLLSLNTLYGTTYYGGTNGNGAVFKVNTDGSGFANLHSFAAGSGSFPHNYTNSEGACPEAGLVLSGNTLYGTAETGGSSGFGAVFKVNTDGSGFTNLHSFTNGSDGTIPEGLLLSGSTLYGVACGGDSGNCTVFKINTNGTGFTTLHRFTGLSLGLALSGKTLYGIGGSSSNGGVFAVNTDGTGFTYLYTNSAPTSDGAEPMDNGGFILSGSTLYGTAYSGGTNGSGTVFAVNTNGTGFTTLYNFTATNPVTGAHYDGANPVAGLTLSGNTLYGTADYGGSAGDGTVFSISLGLVVTTASLPNGTNGVAYDQQLSAFNGQRPYSWSLLSGSLPSGLTLTTNGVISGTPTTNGTDNFTVQVTDALSATATQPLTLLVVGPPSVVWIQPTNNSITVPVGSDVTFAVSVVGTGPFSYQWQLNGTNLPNGMITTVAGGRTGGLGDGGAATNAELNGPYGVAVDATGNLFIADRGNSRIRKVGANGMITTVAGGGTGGLGDGGAATNAELNGPYGVAVDATGNLFIADTGNNVIREVGSDGMITTVAGNGYVNPITGWGGYSGDGGPATNAELNEPTGVAVDGTGNLFIVDSENNVIREVGTDGIISTVGGNGWKGYSGDGGAATNAELAYPYGVAVDATDNFFIADTYNNVIREVGTNGIITTVAGSWTNGYAGDGGAATKAELSGPYGVAVDATGNLFIADTWNNVIREVGTNGIITTVAGNGYGAGTLFGGGYSGDGGAATNAELNGTFGVAMDTTGNLFIADTGNNVIRKVVFPSPTLVLNDVSGANAGAYDVVVSSPYGSVTSSNIVLTITSTLPVILTAPQITVGKTSFTFQLSGPAGSNYVLQISTNLLNWSSVSTSTMPVSGTMTMTNAISGYNRRFYRVYLQ